MSENSLKNQNIEFIRGLAVIIVFFFHYNPQIFSSFFVGVDIFFLVSGYVITLSVFKKKKFEIESFYLRRIKRIYPNLIFILIVFSIFYFFFYNEYYNDFETNFFSIFFSFFGISNFYYSLNPNLFYFNEEIRWLIHTWSLSVEIQFYIIFGLIFSLYFRFFINNDTKKIFFISTLFFIILFSISFFIFTEIKFISDYYSLAGRLWEFSLGSMMYFYNFKKRLNFNILISIFLLTLSLSNLLILNKKIIIVYSIIFVFVSFLISKDLKNNLITNIIRFFGRLSYSFYLWHLIAISFLRGFLDFLIFDFMFIFLVTTFFSFLSYKYIEIKFNKKFNYDFYFKKFIFVFSLSLPIILVYIFLFNINLINKSFNTLNKYSINFFNFIDRRHNFIDQNSDIIAQRYDKCENTFEIFNFSNKVNCINYQSNSELVYLMGNSYADHLVPAILEIFSKSTIYNARLDNCYVSYNIKCKKNKLDLIIDQYLEISKDYKKKVIILSLNNKKFSKIKMKNLIDKLKSDNTKIILIYPHPSTNVILDKEKFSNYNLIKNQDLQLLKTNFNLIIYDTFKFVCTKCDFEEYQKYFIEDGSHFNLKGSLNLVNSLEKFYKSN